MNATKSPTCSATVPCTDSNPCCYCRNEWFQDLVKPLNFTDPVDVLIYEEAKKHLNPRKTTLKD